MSQCPPLGGTALDVLLGYLKAEQVEVVFGVPGGLLHPVFAALEADPALRLVVAKHETGAAFMADGYARAGRRLSVCATTSGPGATNALTGVAVAFADGVPLLVLTGQVPRRAMGKGASQETSREDMDIVAMFRPVTKYSAQVAAADQLSHHLRRALRRALTGRPGPVHLNVPVDLWREPISEDWFAPHTYRPRTDTFDRQAVQRAADELLAAEHPVILCGAGVAAATAEEHLATLAELLPAQVATSPRAKGLFPEDHPLSLGVLGYAGHETARRAILGDEVDVLLAVGASLGETTTGWSPELRPSRSLLQLDVDADRIGRNFPVDVPLLGDAQTVLVELVYHLHRAIREGSRPSSQWPQEPVSARGHDWYLDPTMRSEPRVPLAPQHWRASLAAILPDDAMVFSDVGGHMLFNIHHLLIKEEQRFFCNLGFASMGHGTTAPIGAALAVPDTPVIAIVGDGCFTMQGMELLTAAEYDVPVVWLVENNHMHGITWHGGKALGQPLEAVRYRRPVDVAAMARAMGLSSWIVDRPGQIEDVLPEALRLRRPAVVELRVDPEVPPPLLDRAELVER